jgi:hypothetical protein
MTKLPTRPPGGDPPPAGGKESRSTADAAIRTGVMGALGRPEDLYQVTVLSLWPGRYRVNVWIGADATSARVAHSYFVSADGAGKVLSSAPPITRLY